MTNASSKKSRRLTVLALFTSAMWLIGTGYGEAQVQTDITKTLPPVGDHADLRLGTEVTAPPHGGHTWTITGGTQAGSNLFHSFQTFSVGSGDTAQFFIFPEGPAVSDIFARVTGAQGSTIHGTIQTVGFGNANLWFMNPNGITFGSGAKLDIGGSAIFTTANKLFFSDSDGGSDTPTFRVFSANSQETPLSIASVTSFGFFSPPGSINVIGSTLDVSAGKTLSLVGGDINIVGGTLRASDGNIRLSSVKVTDNCDGFCSTFVDIDTSLAHFFNSEAPSGTILLAQAPGGKDTILDTSSSGRIQINGLDYQGTNTADFNLFTSSSGNGFPNIVFSNGRVVVGNVTPVDSYLVANLPSTKLIVSTPAVSTLTPPTTIDIGDTGTLTAKLNHPFTASVGVDVSSNNAGVVPSSARVDIPAGQDTAQVQFHGIAPAKASITAKAVDITVDCGDCSNPTRSITTDTGASATVQVAVPTSQVAPAPATLVEGSNGTVTVSITRPLKQDVTINLTSSNTGVLTVEPTATIKAGEISVNVPYATKQFGSAVITASLQTLNQPAGTPKADISVTPDPITTLTPNRTLDEGKSSTLTVTLGQPAPHPIQVIFSSSDPNAVAAPGPITIPLGQTTATVPVTGAHVGAATITAAYAGDTAAAALTVVLAALPSQLAPTPLTLVEGSGGTVTITLSKPSTQPVTIALTSSNPGVLTPQATVTIPANQTTATVPYATQQFGDATVTAALQVGGRAVGTTTSAPIHVTPDPITTLTPNRTLDEGKSSTLTITLGQPASHPITINFTSSDPNAVPAPGPITVPVGQSTATVPVTATHRGSATITAAYAGDTAAAAVLVTLPLDSQLAPTPVTLVEGSGGTLTVTLTRATDQPTQVTLTSSAPGVLTTTQTTATIPANQTSVTIPYLTKQFGDVTVTASLQSAGQPVGTSHSALIHVTPDPITTLTPNRALEEGAPSTLLVTLGQPAPHPIQVTFTSSDPNAVPAPGPITIQPNQTTATVPISGTHSGSTTITARYAGDTAAASIQVVLTTLPSQLAATPVALVEGNGGTVTVTLSKPTAQPITVALTSSDSSVLTPQATVTIPANQTTVTVPYSTQQFGDATVTAILQAGGRAVGTTTSAPIHVTPDPITTLTPNRTLDEGKSSTLTVTLGQPASHPITINFTSSDPNAVPAPGPITVPIGQSTATVPVTAAHGGTARITAVYAGDTADTSVHVNQAGTSIANVGGQSLTNLAVTTRTPKDPPAMQPLPIPPGTQLVIASGRCAAGAKGEFSSFVQRGRDASPASPGGPLASPPILDESVPRISGISVQPGTVTLQASHSLQLAPGISPFLARNGGC